MPGLQPEDYSTMDLAGLAERTLFLDRSDLDVTDPAFQDAAAARAALLHELESGEVTDVGK